MRSRLRLCPKRLDFHFETKNSRLIVADQMWLYTSNDLLILPMDRECSIVFNFGRKVNTYRYNRFANHLYIFYS